MHAIVENNKYSVCNLLINFFLEKENLNKCAFIDIFKKKDPDCRTRVLNLILKSIYKKYNKIEPQTASISLHS